MLCSPQPHAMVHGGSISQGSSGRLPAEGLCKAESIPKEGGEEEEEQRSQPRSPPQARGPHKSVSNPQPQCCQTRDPPSMPTTQELGRGSAWCVVPPDSRSRSKDSPQFSSLA